PAAPQRYQRDDLALAASQRPRPRIDRCLPAAHRSTVQLKHHAQDEVAAGDDLAVRCELHPRVTAVAADQLPVSVQAAGAQKLPPVLLHSLAGALGDEDVQLAAE